MYARMKKIYFQPRMAVHCYSTETIAALSGNFTEGETTNEGVYDTPIDGNEAWAKGNWNDVWDEENK